MTEALLFDVFGTLVDWRSSIAAELERFGAGRGIARDWTAMAERWRAFYQPSMEPIRTGARGYVTLDTLHRESLDRLLADFELSDVGQGEREALVRAWHRLAPWPDTVPGLTRLKDRYILAPVSNGNIALMVGLARHAGLPWDAVLGAEIARDYKPKPAVYLESARALDLPPEACTMVAAHNYDLKAARALGFRTAFVARPREYGPNQTTDLAAEADWDLVAEDLVDLAAKLGC